MRDVLQRFGPRNFSSSMYSQKHLKLSRSEPIRRYSLRPIINLFSVFPIYPQISLFLSNHCVEVYKRRE